MIFDAPETMKWTLNMSEEHWDRHIYIYDRAEDSTWDLIYFTYRQVWHIQTVGSDQGISESPLPKNWVPA